MSALKMDLSFNMFRECVGTIARTRRSLGYHLLQPMILRLLVICAPAVLRPRALQDAPAPADPNSNAFPDYVCTLIILI